MSINIGMSIVIDLSMNRGRFHCSVIVRYNNDFVYFQMYRSKEALFCQPPCSFVNVLQQLNMYFVLPSLAIVGVWFSGAFQLSGIYM